MRSESTKVERGQKEMGSVVDKSGVHGFRTKGGIPSALGGLSTNRLKGTRRISLVVLTIGGEVELIESSLRHTWR